MRVLFVINGLGTGGAQRSLWEILPYLSEAGIKTSVVCLHRSAEGLEDKFKDRGEDVRYLEGRHVVTRVANLRALIQELQPDVMHTTIWESNLIGRIANANKLPLLTSLVTMPYAANRRLDPGVHVRRLRIVQRLDSWTARHLTTHFHAITNAVKDHAVDALGIPPGRITVIERGRDEGRMGAPSLGRRSEARRELGLTESDRVLINVGRQEFVKGQLFLIEALRSMEPSSRPTLLQVGRAGLATEALKKASRGLESHIRFLGHREDVPQLLPAADVFVFPSLVEGMGGALLEAMALGLPIVATDIPAIREVVRPGENATLVPAGSAAALASVIQETLDSPHRLAQFASRSRDLFLQRFTLDRCAMRTIELYEALANVQHAGDRDAARDFRAEPAMSGF